MMQPNSQKLDVVAQTIALLDTEKSAWSSELHDGLIQYIIGARMWLNSVQSACQRASDETRNALEVISHSLDRAVHDAGKLMTELSGGQSLAIRAASDDRMARFDRIFDVWSQQLQLDFERPEEHECSDSHTVVLSFILQVLLKDAAAAWKATRVSIQLNHNGDEYDLTVDHDGNPPQRGPYDESPRLGLVEQLVTMLDGQLKANFGPAGGRLIGISLPTE